MGRKRRAAAAAAPRSRARRRRRRSQRGGKLFDVQNLLNKTGIEFHWPGYQYMGPGTHLKKRLARGDPGINRLDRIAKAHDMDYDKAKTLKIHYQILEARVTSALSVAHVFFVNEEIPQKWLQMRRDRKLQMYRQMLLGMPL